MNRAWIPLAALAAAVFSFAQDVTFRAGTRLVEVSVTVLDSSGNAVTGLRPDDFILHDEGQPRPVAFLQFDGEPAASTAQTPLPRGTFTNIVEIAGGAPRNISALVLDELNTLPEDSARVRAEMMRYLKALAPGNRIAVFHLGPQLRILHDFIDDADSLRDRIEKAEILLPADNIFPHRRLVKETEELKKIVSLAGGGEFGRVQLEAEMAANAAVHLARMDRSLAAMDALGQHLAGIPGRKNAIWITGGLSMAFVQGAMGPGNVTSGSGSVKSYETRVRDAARRLAQRGIALYIVDAAGLETSGPPIGGETPAVPDAGTSSPPIGDETPAARYMAAAAINADPFPAMSLMASITGGRHLFNSNDLTTGFRHAVSDLRGSYTLGFYIPEDGDDQWHRLRVRVARPDVAVHHRDGYFAQSAAAPQPVWNDESWRAAIMNPLGSSAVRFVVTCRPGPEDDLLFDIRVAANSLLFRPRAGEMKADLEVMIAGRSAEGRIWRALRKVEADLPAETAARLRTAVLPIRRRWKPHPAVETVRVIVRDKAAGQYGTVDVPLKKLAPPPNSGPPPAAARQSGAAA